MITFIQHIDIEGPAVLQTSCLDAGIPFRIIDVSNGEPLPDDWKQISGVVVLGGPMNVYEEDRYPFLREENAFIRNALARNVPYLGICLGSQLLAKAAGAAVTKAAVSERGFGEVRLTPAGQQDPLFAGAGPALDVFQWHDDTFAVPEGGELLATSPVCAHQAFRIGARAYGVQFHFEITAEDIRAWSLRYLAGHPGREQAVADMLADYREKADRFTAVAKRLTGNFFQMALAGSKNS